MQHQRTNKSNFKTISTMQTKQLGIELRETGRLIDNKELMLVHLHLKAGESVPAHDHVGQDVYFTVVGGAVEVTLNAEERHTLHPGGVLHFAGEASVGVEALTDSDFFVYLINRQ